MKLVKAFYSISKAFYVLGCKILQGPDILGIISHIALYNVQVI